MTWTAYPLPPIDFGWSFLPTVEDVAADFARHDAGLAVHGNQFELPMLQPFLADFERAKELAAGCGWEGDYRDDARPRVLFLPRADSNIFNYGFAWKQDNNGSTFIISPEPLPWCAKWL